MTLDQAIVTLKLIALDYEDTSKERTALEIAIGMMEIKPGDLDKDLEDQLTDIYGRIVKIEEERK